MQVYRFRDSVALSTHSEVFYLTRREAQALARALHACGVDIAKNPDFVDSKFTAFKLGDRTRGENIRSRPLDSETT